MKGIIRLSLAIFAGLLFTATAPHAASVEVGLSFDGASIHNAVPWHFAPDSIQFVPDSNGAVGPNHVVIMVNGRFAVHQKNDGALLQERDLVVFWADAGADIGPVADYSVWDPRIVYDAASQRWFAVSVGAPFASFLDPIPSNLLLAVSRTADPTQEWVGFEFPDPANSDGWLDYPTLGVNTDGVYVAAKIYPLAPPFNKFLGMNVLVVPKSDLLAATPTIANATMFVKVPWGDESESRRNAQPVVDLDGGGLPETLVDFSAASPEARPVTMQINGPITSPSLGERRTVVKNKYVRPMSMPVDADQPGDKPNLYAGRGSLGSAVKRNGTIWAAQHLFGEKYGNDAIRWLRIDPEKNKVIESGVIEHPDLDLTYPSIAVNEHDDVVIGVSGSSETQYGSAYAVAGQTLGGVTFFGDLELLVPGVADFYINAADYFPGAGTRNNWNDYTTTVVDPSDPHKFWTFQEYVSAVDEWSVAAVAMSFVGCEGVANGPTFESLRCRIYELRDLVEAESELYSLQTIVANDLWVAGKQINKARAKCTNEVLKATQRKIKATANRMQKCIDRFETAAAIAELSAEIREEYKAAAAPIQRDAVLLQGQVACPDDAPW